MEERITLCGDNCTKCPRYKAHSAEELKAVAELWYKIGWRDKIVSNKEICSPTEYIILEKAFFDKENNLKK